MKNRKKIIACGILFIALFLSACAWEIGTSDYKRFSDDLIGTWVSSDPSVYSGKLVINTDRINITGFNEAQTPSGEDDNKRPFKGFTKGVNLKGYSEEGKIFIEDRGLLREGIPYDIFIAEVYPQRMFLYISFGGREETLQKQ